MAHTARKLTQQLLLKSCFLISGLLTQPLLAQPTSAAESPATSSAPSGVHPRSAETARWFDRAELVVVRAIAEVERAQYADELHSLNAFVIPYLQDIDASSIERNWVRANFPCLQKLNSPAWLKQPENRSLSASKEYLARFAKGEKLVMLAELRAYLDALKIMRSSCMAAAPYYYSDGNHDYVLGDVVDIQPSGATLLVRLRTPLMTDQILLQYIKSTAHMNPQIAQAIQKWASVYCYEKTALAVMANELRSAADKPAATYLKPMLGNVACASNAIEVGLLGAGLVDIDMTQSINPDTHPAWFVAMRAARAAKRGIWATDAGAPPTSLGATPDSRPPLISPAQLAPPIASGAGDLCSAQAAWKLRAVVEADAPNQRREYTGVLCLEVPAPPKSAVKNTVQTIPIRGTSHWNCCPGARSDVMVGTLDVQANGQKSITLKRMLAAPHLMQTYTGQLQVVAGAPTEQMSIVGTWTQESMADGVLRSFVATPLNRLTFAYANPWFN